MELITYLVVHENIHIISDQAHRCHSTDGDTRIIDLLYFVFVGQRRYKGEVGTQ